MEALGIGVRHALLTFWVDYLFLGNRQRRDRRNHQGTQERRFETLISLKPRPRSSSTAGRFPAPNRSKLSPGSSMTSWRARLARLNNNHQENIPAKKSCRALVI
jgi:hypothetical protein